jgi:hypothetical protein
MFCEVQRSFQAPATATGGLPGRSAGLSYAPAPKAYGCRTVIAAYLRRRPYLRRSMRLCSSMTFATRLLDLVTSLVPSP